MDPEQYSPSVYSSASNSPTYCDSSTHLLNSIHSFEVDMQLRQIEGVCEQNQQIQIEIEMYKAKYCLIKKLLEQFHRQLALLQGVIDRYAYGIWEIDQGWLEFWETHNNNI
jgi:hypothetical protein